MHPGAATYALSAPASPHRVRRLCVFIAVSLALHALLLGGGYTPRGSASGNSTVPEWAGAPLHAVLAPAPSAEAKAEEAQAPRPDVAGTPAPSNAQSAPVEAGRAAAAASGSALPLPDKWYTASELEVLAEPLRQVKLAYPPEFLGSAMIEKVRIRLFIDELGIVRKTEIVEGAAERAFDTAAITQWQAVRFKPGQKDGIAVKSQKLLELDYFPF